MLLSVQNCLEKNEAVVQTGEAFGVDGFYHYDGHVLEDSADCFVPGTAYYMFFRKNTVAGGLGTCPHKIRWKLISSR